MSIISRHWIIGTRMPKFHNSGPCYPNDSFWQVSPKSFKTGTNWMNSAHKLYNSTTNIHLCAVSPKWSSSSSFIKINQSCNKWYEFTHYESNTIQESVWVCDQNADTWSGVNLHHKKSKVQTSQQESTKSENLLKVLVKSNQAWISGVRLGLGRDQIRFLDHN